MHVRLFAVYAIFATVLLVAMSSLRKRFEGTGGSMDSPSRRLLFERGQLARTAKRDCDVETVYSMENAQCDAVCKPPGVYHSRNGVCVNVLFLAASESTSENECDSKRGVIAYLSGNAQFGKTSLVCLSIDPGIAADDPRKPNALCSGEYVRLEPKIDYDARFPETGECACYSDATRLTLPETRNVRSRLVCASKKVAPVFRHVGIAD